MNLTTRTPKSFNRLLAGAVLLAGFAAAPVSYAGNYGGNCVSYQLKSYGGEAGVRTLENPGDFRRTGGHTSGQFCGSGRIKVELSKRDPHTHVSLLVGGNEYVFGQGDRGDRQANHWYRRYFHINLPRRNQGYAQNNGHNKGHNNGYDNSYNDGYNNGYAQKHNKKKRRNKQKDHGNKHYPGSGHSYQNDNYNNNYGYQQNDYQPSAHKPKHSHGHGIGPKPRLRIDSKIHRKAHKLHLPHQHKRQNYAYQ